MNDNSSVTLGDLIAAIGAVIIVARLIVKLTPTPKDNTWLERAVAALKHIGLHIPALALTALLATGCGSTGQLSTGYDPASGELLLGGGIQNSNLAVELQAAYDLLHQQPGAITVSVLFRDAPSPEEAAALTAAGALRVRPNLFALALPDTRAADHPAFAALRRALYAGARVAPLPPARP
jgi:hypothetical protein